ncbi:14793_t:CDS:2, partial [Dentiscutata heterogama]
NVAKIEARNQAHAQKIMNQKACLEGFNFNQNLAPYGQMVQKSLETIQFHPSFATKIPNFKTIIKCGDKDEPDSKNRILDAIVSEVFNFTEFRPKQRESIDSFTAGNNTLYILPTVEGKIFIYASSALLFMGLTKNGQLKLISATTVFGIGLNVNDVHTVIHTIFPMSIDALVQETGHASHPSDEEACLETNSSADIIQWYEYLQRKQDSIFEIIAYCKSVYECRQQQAYQSFL